MHWIDETAEQLIKNHPDTDTFVCAAGITPSGPIHMGNFREFLTSYFITEGLKDKGKKVRFIMSFDNFDRFRKVPADVKKIVGDSFDKYVGMPDADIPDPWGCHKNYSEHFASAFVDSVKQFGIECEYLYQVDKYRNGEYIDGIKKAVINRKEIYDILHQFKTKDFVHEKKLKDDSDRDLYVPVEIYCSKCNKDYTTVTKISDDNMKLTYKCSVCGNEETIDINTYKNMKLVWKADWPMRWAHERVIFEPGGKDHGTEGSSYSVGKLLAPKVYNFNAPDFVMYEMIGLKGGAGKMSSSAGSVPTPADLLKICPPEMILWLYSRVPARQSFVFSFDDEIIRQYHEFDRMVTAYNKEDCPQNIKDIIKYALVNKKDKRSSTANAQLLLSFGSIVNFDTEMVYNLFKRVVPDVRKEDILDRLPRIKYWAETYAPEKITRLLNDKNTEYFKNLSEKEQKDIRETYRLLKEKEYSLEELQQVLYAIPKDNSLSDKENRPIQTKYFENIYNLLIGSSTGPRLYLFLGALDKELYLPLLNF